MANEILAENIAFDENGLYIPQTWLDGVGEENFTPMTADRMNHIEQGIKGLSDAWDSQSRDPIMDKSFTDNGWRIELTHIEKNLFYLIAVKTFNSAISAINRDIVTSNLPYKASIAQSILLTMKTGYIVQGTGDGEVEGKTLYVSCPSCAGAVSLIVKGIVVFD